ncbi:MAG: signal peptidase I, partial [Trebonia sp.]
MVLTVVIGLAAWTFMPRALGWQSRVVMTGSMRPRIDPGDVIVAAPVAPDDVHAGQVVLVRDPAQPDRALVHRVVQVRPDGQLITQGDANRDADSTPVP